MTEEGEGSPNSRKPFVEPDSSAEQENSQTRVKPIVKMITQAKSVSRTASMRSKSPKPTNKAHILPDINKISDNLYRFPEPKLAFFVKRNTIPIPQIQQTTQQKSFVIPKVLLPTEKKKRKNVVFDSNSHAPSCPAPPQMLKIPQIACAPQCNIPTPKVNQIIPVKQSVPNVHQIPLIKQTVGLNLNPVIPRPAVSLQNTNTCMTPPERIAVNDPKKGLYYIRCVCGGVDKEGLTICCESCHNYLHGGCVNMPRMSINETYYCPFCRGQKIHCICRNNKNYSDPLIQCSVCKLWVHKTCEKLEYGRSPDNFVCSFCSPEKIYSLPLLTLQPTDIGLRKDVVAQNIRRGAIIDRINEGEFKIMIMNDLSLSELSLCSMIPKYFHVFGSLFFEKRTRFWKMFVATFSAIFDVSSDLIIDALDALAFKLLYNSSYNSVFPVLKETIVSEALEPFIALAQIQELDALPQQLHIKRDPNGKVVVEEQVENGQFIAELPGFFMHCDEAKTDKGIPPSYITVTDNEFVIDVGVSSMSFAAFIKRSFHYNCIAKMVKVKGSLKVCLYGIIQANEEKAHAIDAGQMLILPFDGGIPYPVAKREWEERRKKHPTRMSRSQSSDHIKEDERDGELSSILSGFTHTAIPVPPLPLVLGVKTEK